MRQFMLLLLVATICGCEDAPPPKKAAAPAAPATPATPPPIDERNTSFQQGGGAAQNVRQAGKRTVPLNDLHQLGLLIAQEELTNGKMPKINDIKTFLKKDAPKILAQIDEGAIILTGSTNKSGLWAYEVDADKASGGGLVLVAGTAKRATTDEVKQLLASK